MTVRKSCSLSVRCVKDTITDSSLAVYDVPSGRDARLFMSSVHHIPHLKSSFNRMNTTAGVGLFVENGTPVKCFKFGDFYFIKNAKAGQSCVHFVVGVG